MHMDEKKRDIGTHELYDETTSPHNPPESMLGPQERTEWLLSSVGTLAVIFVIVAAAFGWVYVRHELVSQPKIYADSKANGGLRPVEGDFRTTEEELKFRGTSGQAPGTAGAAPGPIGSMGQEPTRIGELKNVPVGGVVLLANVKVDRTDGPFVWVRDGDDTFIVAVPGDTPTVTAGQRVNISGTIESNGASKWLRASRIDVR